MARPEDLLIPTSQGLWCAPGGFYIDPVRPVAKALVTHGHADHARPGHGAVLATAPTAEMMRLRFGAGAGSLQTLRYGERLRVGEVTVRLAPAGHVLGSAQAALEWNGLTAVVSGDYKRRRDPTCDPFEPIRCHVFVTEATFGLPVFRHPHDGDEIARLLRMVEIFPERSALVGVYALGKAQRVIRLLREAGWERPVWLHGALQAMCALYERQGVELGELRPATGASRAELRGQIVLAPPSALGERWSRRLPEPIAAMASGWMRVRARARQRGAELPLVISDHADWDELNATVDELAEAEIWVTHGREEALVRAATLKGRSARALALVGYEDEDAE
jgi:putative mRNA 3-end processing factor